MVFPTNIKSDYQSQLNYLLNWANQIGHPETPKRVLKKGVGFVPCPWWRGGGYGNVDNLYL